MLSPSQAEYPSYRTDKFVRTYTHPSTRTSFDHVLFLWVEERIRSVVGSDQSLKVPVLNQHRLQTIFQSAKQTEEFADVKRLSGECFATAGVTISKELQEHCCPANIIVLGQPCSQLFQFLRLGSREHDLGQFKFFFQIGIIKLLVKEELFQNGKIISGIQIAEPQFSDQCHCSCLHTMKEIDKVVIEVVVDLKRGWFRVSQ